MTHVHTSISQCRDGDLLVVLTSLEDAGILELKLSPTELRKICFMFLSECDKVDSFRYSPTMGHA
jgi:hypothetical protein